MAFLDPPKTMTQSPTPFVLIARITVRPGCVEQYLELAATVDAAVEATEPGMLLHTLDQDPRDAHRLVWTEVYRDSSDFLAHAANPPVMEYVEKHAELSEDFSVELYGAVADEVVMGLESLGIPVLHFDRTPVGFIRTDRLC